LLFPLPSCLETTNSAKGKTSPRFLCPIYLWLPQDFFVAACFDKHNTDNGPVTLLDWQGTNNNIKTLM